MTESVWRKSSHSGTQQGNCVEVAAFGAVIGLRDSKHPELPHLSVSPAALSNLFTQVRTGSLDLDL